jgi:hypothetical protein
VRVVQRCCASHHKQQEAGEGVCELDPWLRSGTPFLMLSGESAIGRQLNGLYLHVARRI